MITLSKRFDPSPKIDTVNTALSPAEILEGAIAAVPVPLPPEISDGSNGDDEFCGLMAVCATKSAALLSESYPFPESASAPPGAREIAVEELFALRSTDDVLLGAGAGPEPS